MKTLLILISGLFFAANPAVTEQVPTSLDDVCTAVGAGRVDDLVAAMGAEVELSILDTEDVYSQADARVALQNFFSGAGKTSFGKVHQGASKSDDAEYCIGTLTTGKGSYRVYVYVAKKSGGVILQELRIDPS